jgi:hypothetical protein
MDIERDHIIHSRGGMLTEGTSSTTDVERIIGRAVGNAPPRGIAIHFHGGLVSRTAGLNIAQKLAPPYERAGVYPIVFVWESGFFEALKNNLNDILKHKVFQELVKKASEWVLKKDAGAVVTRGRGQTINTAQVRNDFDEWFAGHAATPPVRLDSPSSSTLATRGVEPDEEELAVEIEVQIETDPDTEFEATLAGLLVSSGRGSEAVTRGAGIAPKPVDVIVDQAALDAMFPVQPAGTTRGGISWYLVAKFVARVVITVLRRFWNGRDHGAYTTVVEEVLRAAYLSKVGEVVWRQMKKDTADAFQLGESVGTMLLNALAGHQSAGRALPTITLIGHSTGAIYINHLIRHAAMRLPGVCFNVIFLAPACRNDDFADVLKAHGTLVGNFRMFAMQDQFELQDRLVPIIYPRSLLYFVSGVLEGDSDVPILGMQRFLNSSTVFSEAKFPEVSSVRSFLTKKPSYAVWSVVAGQSGMCSSSKSHGDFDDDADTLASIAVILAQGF